MNNFEPIDRWKNKNLHLRNIEIALEIANGKSGREVGKFYDICRHRVTSIYRILAAKLYERHFKKPYDEAIKDKSCYRHEEIKSFLISYHQDYIEWMTKYSFLKLKILM
jgi:hypothetical protein